MLQANCFANLFPFIHLRIIHIISNDIKQQKRHRKIPCLSIKLKHHSSDDELHPRHEHDHALILLQ